MRIRWHVLTLLILVGLNSCKESKDGTPEGNGGTLDAYVLVVSFDGFRWDYPDLYDTPNFDSMEQKGVKAEYLISPAIS